MTAAMKLKDTCSLERKTMTNLDSILKSRDIILPTKFHLVKAMVFLVFMYGCENWIIKKARSVSRSVVPNSLRPHELQPTRLFCPWDFPGKDIGVGCHFFLQGIFPTQGLNPGLLYVRQILYPLSYKGSHKEGWALKNWCFWTMVREKTLGSPLDCKDIKPVNPKGNQSWIFTGGTDAEADAPILWPPDAKNWLIRKDPDAGKDWRWEEKGTTEDEMVGWHHGCDGLKFEQGSLACCPWGREEWSTTVHLNSST